MTQAPPDMLAAALEYARLGYPVFPCWPGTKQPATQHGIFDAATHPPTIRRLWQYRRNANIGLVAAGLLIIDVDPGAAGWPGPQRAAVIKRLTPPLQKTPRGGWHIVFAKPKGATWRCSAGRLAPGVDVRTDGGYIVVAPSVTQHGAYRWIRPLLPRAKLPLPPDWLCRELDRIAKTEQAKPDQAPAGRSATDGPVLTEGMRNSGLTSLAGRLRRDGLSQAELEAALLEANRRRCQPPLTEAEVLSIARSISRYQPAPPQIPAIKRAWRRRSGYGVLPR